MAVWSARRRGGDLSSSSDARDCGKTDSRTFVTCGEIDHVGQILTSSGTAAAAPSRVPLMLTGE